MKITGKVSHFGGPKDTGVTPSEDLAFWEDYSKVARPEELFLPKQPPNTTGLARRLDPAKLYIATRWDYDDYPKSELMIWGHVVRVVAPKTGRFVMCRPADWGPNENTSRVADVSPAALEVLGIQTDDTVEVTYPYHPEEPVMAIHRVAISAGHGKKVAGCTGVDGLHEEVETPKVMRAVAEELRKRGVTVMEFWDEKSTTQQQNLDAIVNWHNKQTRDLDVSIHFNASNGQGHGVECLFVTQDELADKVAETVAAVSGLADRGGKYRDNLAFLNGTNGPAILIECLFLDNRADVDIYKYNFSELCTGIAVGITGWGAPIAPPKPSEPEPSPEQKEVVVNLTVPDGVELKLIINGVAFIVDEKDQ